MSRRDSAQGPSGLAGRTLLPSPRSIMVLSSVVALITTLVGLAGSRPTSNNFDIFRWSFGHLIRGMSLYSYHADHHDDFYKYGPCFALLMAPFRAIPRTPGVLIWNLLNVLVPCLAVSRLKIDHRAQSSVMLFVMIELTTSIRNAQSNGLIAGLMIGALSAFEARRVVLAAILIALATSIKPFAAVGGLLFLFHERKAVFLVAATVSTAVLAALPGVVTGWDGLLFQYRGWIFRLAHDPSHDGNYSVMTLGQVLIGYELRDAYYLAPGLILLLAPFVRRDKWADPGYRLMSFGSILLWVVLFNHKAESPTYVIAAYGAAFWGLTAPKTATRVTFLLLFLFLTELSSTDVFPPFFRVQYIQPYRLKALPGFLIWTCLAGQLLTLRRFEYPSSTVDAVPGPPSPHLRIIPAGQLAQS